jgi:hypothetical protein
MKLRSVECNNHKREFVVTTRSGRTYSFPYAKCEPSPNADDRVHDVYVDPEMGREGFSYVLESGDEGAIHVDSVLDYNADPAALSRAALYRLTLEARQRVEESSLSKREIMRRLGTSATQFYRLLDTTNYRKSMNQLIALLHVVGYEVEFDVRRRET